MVFSPNSPNVFLLPKLHGSALGLQLWDREGRHRGEGDVTVFTTDIKPSEFLQQVPDLLVTQMPRFRVHTPSFPSPVEELAELSYPTSCC